jgi:hypothetical protein
MSAHDETSQLKADDGKTHSLFHQIVVKWKTCARKIISASSLPASHNVKTHLVSNSIDPIIRIPVRRSPIPRHPPTRRIPDNFHSHTQLRHDLLIRQSGHHRVRPGMDGDIVTCIEDFEEEIGSLEDVLADHKVGGCDILGLEEGYEVVRALVKNKTSGPSRIERQEKKKRPTAIGPSSKLVANTPSGASLITPFPKHPAVCEQMSGLSPPLPSA